VSGSARKPAGACRESSPSCRAAGAAFPTRSEYLRSVASFPGIRLHVVTGKGGTGKTTVAAALALSLASGGGRVLLAEVEGRQGLAGLFGRPPLPYAETRVATTASGGEILGLAVDAELALVEYLEMFYTMGRAGRLLGRLGAIDFVTTIAPGLRDVLLIGKVKEAAVRRHGAGHWYDAVVLDAPPTGRIVPFLGATGEVADLAPAGPIHAQSDAVMTLLRSSQTAIHLVTVLEQMPVQETVDGAAQIEAAGLPLGRVFVNRVREPQLSDADLAVATAGRLDAAALSAAFGSAGLDADLGLAKVLAEEAGEHARRVALERAERRELEELGLPLVELPLVPDGIDLEALHELAEAVPR
jgi:anion-transporting  ArsA/GET3 family ATPase